jgi:hypothetical protein
VIDDLQPETPKHLQFWDLQFTIGSGEILFQAFKRYSVGCNYKLLTIDYKLQYAGF